MEYYEVNNLFWIYHPDLSDQNYPRKNKEKEWTQM